MRKLLLILLACCFAVLGSGCTAFATPIYESTETMGMELLGTPEVHEAGYKSMWNLVLPENSEAPHSIQDVNLHLGWVGVEAHKQPMQIVDFHYHTQHGEPYVYSERDMFVRPGEVEGADWHIKGVAMISDWPGPDENGVYRHNALYYEFKIWFIVVWEHKMQGRVVWADDEKGLRWKLQWFPRDADNHLARLRYSIPGTEIEYVWDEEGLLYAKTQAGEEIRNER